MIVPRIILYNNNLDDWGVNLKHFNFNTCNLGIRLKFQNLICHDLWPLGLLMGRGGQVSKTVKCMRFMFAF